LASPADIVVYGGAAGGGKTYALLLETLRHVDNPNFHFVLFRRSIPQITAADGLWTQASQIYPLMGAKSNESELRWRFPSGATGKFAHLQHDATVHDWQGTELPLIGFDELTHFTEDQFFYLLSRNRSTSGVRPYVRATTNPAAGSWVKRFLAPWVDASFPHPARHGEVRWFTRAAGEIHWVHEGWRDADGHGPKSVTFIFSSVYDNKILLGKDPGYLVNLKSLPAVEQARLLRGDWDILEGAYFDEWSESVHTRPAEPVPGWWRFFGGLDYGQSAPFCFLLCAADERGNVTVLDETYGARLHPSEQAHRIHLVMKRNGVDARKCQIWADPSIFPPKSPEARRARPGRYIAEDYWEAGLCPVPANNDRLNGWARLREYLHSTAAQAHHPPDDRAGTFTVFRGKCPHLTRTLATIRRDPRDPEDVDTNADDHAADALRYALMSRPASAQAQRKHQPDHRPWFLKRQEYYA
jgi:hypothetical protein